MGLVLASWASLGPPLVVLGPFLGASAFEVAFRSDFFRFWTDLGWILEGFWVGFLMIFRIFCKNSDFAKTLKKHRFLQCF